VRLVAGAALNSASAPPCRRVAGSTPTGAGSSTPPAALRTWLEMKAGRRRPGRRDHVGHARTEVPISTSAALPQLAGRWQARD